MWSKKIILTEAEGVENWVHGAKTFLNCICGEAAVWCLVNESSIVISCRRQRDVMMTMQGKCCAAPFLTWHRGWKLPRRCHAFLHRLSLNKFFFRCVIVVIWHSFLLCMDAQSCSLTLTPLLFSGLHSIIFFVFSNVGNYLIKFIINYHFLSLIFHVPFQFLYAV